MPASNLSLRPLEDGEDPELGLFFLEAGTYPGPDGYKASGMAFLAGSDGLFVTCSHVLTALCLFPHARVTLHAASATLALSVEASVLAEGWRGPEWQELILHGEAPNAKADLPPEAFREDIAFLKLIPGTARDHVGRVGAQGDAEERLQALARVLPLASPGYRHGSRAKLQAWHVWWSDATPDLRPGDAEFLAVEPGLQGCIRFESKDVTAGYSGSPLWDRDRSRVVGMVRRGIKATVDNGVLGVDARQIAMHGASQLQPDAAAQAAVTAFAETAGLLAPMRHFPILRSLLPASLLDLRATLAIGRDPLDDGARGSSAIALVRHSLEDEPVTVLSGGAGAGKSTLLYALAQSLITDPVIVSGRRLLPVYVRAADFQGLNFDLDRLLEVHPLKIGWKSPGNQTVRDILAMNDLSPALLLDGLDEIARQDRALVLSGLKGVQAANRNLRVIVATRPGDDFTAPAESGRTLGGWPVYELEALDGDEVQELAALLLEGDDNRSAFVSQLKAIAWNRRGPTPLQVTAAASFYRLEGKIEGRAVDLPFLFADHLLVLGKVEDARARNDRPRSAGDQKYLEGLQRLVQQLAELTLAGVEGREDVETKLDESGGQPWSGCAGDWLRFLDENPLLAGGVLGWSEVDRTRRIVWAHRTITEALAAQAIARRSEDKPLAGLAAFQAAAKEGQTFGLTVLAALDTPGRNQQTVELALSRVLAEGARNYKMTLFAVRALGAEIRVGEVLHRRLVKTLITVLLLPPGAQLGSRKCRDLFSTDEMPAPLEIAERPKVREEIVKQLRERWRMSDAGRRAREGGSAPARVLTAREVDLLDRLAMWSDIDVPIVRPAPKEAGATIGRTLRSFGPSSAARGEIGSQMVPAALLSHAVKRLQQDADGFLRGFAEFVQGEGAALPPDVAAHIYVASVLASAELLDQDGGGARAGGGAEPNPRRATASGDRFRGDGFI